MSALEATPGGGGVVGWVEGVSVPEADLEPYIARLAGSLLAGDADLGDASGMSGAWHPHQQRAVRCWAAKVLLCDRLLAHEAERLGISLPSSWLEWAQYLERTGEIGPAPSRSDAFAYYQANSHLFRVPEARRAEHLLVRDEARARELAAVLRLRAGTPGQALDLAQLARAVSAGEGEAGGELGWVERGQLAGPLEDAVFSARLGELAGPVRSGFGWHLIVVEAVRLEGLRSFADCEAEILRQLARARLREGWEHWWHRRLAEAVQVAPGLEHPLLPGLPGFPHRH
ncbi:MAG TPA: peptidylprolyl isomerase [Acidimicrobiales bacterium]|nr:peptidylprolyl isomerase [Acidimicrobiales bacterium]